MNWRHVGIYTFNSQDLESRALDFEVKTITGKALQVGNLLVTVPDPVLQEA